MNINIEKLKEKILASQGKIKADFILRNAKIADVYSLEWKLADIVVSNGHIVAVDTPGAFTAKSEEDAKGKYVVPGLKLTDTGLFDVLAYKHIPIQV